MIDEFFKEALRKEKAFFEQCEGKPHTTIIGLVSSNGATGGNIPPEAHWSLKLSLVAWREVGGNVNHSSLAVCKQVTSEQLHDIQAMVKPETLISFSAIIVSNSPYGDTRAQLIGLLEDPIDSELENIRQQYVKPVTVNDPILGVLTLNKAIKQFEGNVNWQGHQINISLSANREDSLSLAIETAKLLWSEWAQWLQKVHEYAATQLLDLKNECWLDEGEPIATTETLLNGMSVASLAVLDDSRFEFWLDDGGLFFGHSIQIAGSISDGVTSADILG